MVVERLSQEVCALRFPFLVASPDVGDRRFKKQFTRFGSLGVSKMTSGLSGVGPPPLRMTHELDNLM
jgi:hypothetical protein